MRKLAFEDATALGEQLQDLDLDLAGRDLDAGANADYQRALDAYESAKTAVEAIAEPDDVRHITQILDDGRYAIACVRARVDGEPLPTRRPAVLLRPAPRLSVTDVLWSPPAGAPRDVPACALDAERVAGRCRSRLPHGHGRAPSGCPTTRAVGAYQPYAAGYFGAFGPMETMFAGMLFGAPRRLRHDG